MTPFQIAKGRLLCIWARTIEDHGIQDFNDWVDAVNDGKISLRLPTPA